MVQAGVLCVWVSGLGALKDDITTLLLYAEGAGARSSTPQRVMKQGAV